MGKKLISILVSTRLTAFLFISFSAAMAAGTFIESMHGTDASKILVYNALWFEIMMILFVVNFIVKIFQSIYLKILNSTVNKYLFLGKGEMDAASSNYSKFKN